MKWPTALLLSIVWIGSFYLIATGITPAILIATILFTGIVA